MKKVLFGFFVVLFVAQCAFTQAEISLDGTWEIIFDDEDRGVTEQWHLNKNFDAHPDKEPIDVPSCWEEFRKNYEGVAFYRTKFTIPESWDDKTMDLKFNASNYMTQVWLNEQVVGFHEGGYTPFSFRVDKLAKPGQENVLTVRVISPIILTDKRIDGLGRQEVPMWRGAITGGIWQSVRMGSSGKLRLTDVFLKPDIHTNNTTFNLELENVETQNTPSEIAIKILSKQGKVVASTNESVEIHPGNKLLSFTLNVPEAILWSLDNPYLYKAEVSIKTEKGVSDEWDTKFGYREFSAKNKQFTLNGKPIYLKACFFEGLYPVKLAYPDSREMAIKEIALAKAAGFNMIRPWRKPASPMWLDLCDSMGVLTVGSLVTECMHRPISTPRLSHVVQNELRKTILANRNRTCIVQWELYNEINRPILTQMLYTTSLMARDLDPTRMILDESGGWGEGANVYLPYQRIPMKFNDIHHYSGSQVHDTEFDGYLAIAKSAKEIKELGLRRKGYGRNVVTGAMSYVSELGYGSNPDLELNNKLFTEKGNPIVAPTIYHQKMARELETALQATGFDKIYPTITEFNLEQHKIHGIANKRMVEATRSNDDIAGYCVHALVGGDWVIGAGLLDLWRNPKTLAYDLTKVANQEQIVVIRVLPRNVYAEKGTQLNITGVSELATEAAKVSIKIESENGKTVFHKTFNKDFEHGVAKLFEHELQTNDYQGNYKLVVEVKNKKGRLITSNQHEFDVFTQKQLTPPKTKIAILEPNKTLSSFFKKKGVKFSTFNTDTDINTLIIVGKALLRNDSYNKKVKDVKTFVQNGGTAIFMEVPSHITPIRRMSTSFQLVEPTELPFGAKLTDRWSTLGGWAGKSHIVTDHPVFDGLPTNMIMHGIYENIHPTSSMLMQKGKYIAGLVGYDHFPNVDMMVRHFIGPGFTFYAANVLEAKVGKGTMLLSTLHILKNLGTDPVAEKILINMIQCYQ